MSLELILKELCAMSDAPKKTIQAACAAAGKRAVGWVAPYGPEELIYAAGCIPVALWGGQVEIKNARTYLPPFACSIMQSIMEKAGAHTEAQTVTISLPLDDTVGLYNAEN